MCLLYRPPSATCRGFIGEGGAGLVVPPGDPGVLADALRTIVLDPALRSRMADARALSGRSSTSGGRRFASRSSTTAC